LRTIRAHEIESRYVMIFAIWCYVMKLLRCLGSLRGSSAAGEWAALVGRTSAIARAAQRCALGYGKHAQRCALGYGKHAQRCALGYGKHAQRCALGYGNGTPSAARSATASTPSAARSATASTPSAARSATATARPALRARPRQRHAQRCAHGYGHGTSCAARTASSMSA
jgi:hypothetical protein